MFTSSSIRYANSFTSGIEITANMEQLRKRHEIFPISTGQPYKYNQPTSMAHIDTTVEWARDMVHKLNGGKASEILEHRIQCVK